MIDARILLVDPETRPARGAHPRRGAPGPGRAPGRRRAARASSSATCRRPATWERADQDLLELFASEIGVAVRNAQLFERVDAQNARLLELDAAKDDFLRGVSHNLQTPLTSIRAYADRLAAERPDRRLGIIVEQADRLSRMVRQLLTVSRLESGTLRPEEEVLALAPAVRRAWEALGVDDVEFALDDGPAAGWRSPTRDQLDQVLWALLDNAVKYGRREPVEVDGRGRGGHRRGCGSRSPTTARGSRRPTASGSSTGSAASASSRPRTGSGLGLYVSRELVRAMSGDLILEPAGRRAAGAAFTVDLPAEPPLES